MINVKEAQEIIKQNVPARKHQKMALREALGYTTSKDIIADYNIPNFAQSSMDGYAIRFEERKGKLKIQGEMQAGTAKQIHLQIGSACRIFTGAPIPDGADTVVMQEKVRLEDDGFLLIEDHELQKGSNVRPAGSDAKKETVTISADSFLSAAAIGYLAGTGCTEVTVYAPPSVSLVLTGNELVQPGGKLEFGQVFESNSYQLESVLKQSGIQDIQTFWVKDDVGEVERILQLCLEKTDIVIFVGGVSVGDYDFVLEATKKCGVEQKFHKIKQKPGKPIYFGTLGGKLVFGLPGNPSSALTCFYLYIAPLLSEITRRPPITTSKKAFTTSAYQKKAGLTHFLKASYSNGKVTPLHAQESYRLQSFAEANALIVIEEDFLGCEKDDEVEIILLS